MFVTRAFARRKCISRHVSHIHRLKRSTTCFMGNSSGIRYPVKYACVLSLPLYVAHRSRARRHHTDDNANNMLQRYITRAYALVWIIFKPRVWSGHEKSHLLFAFEWRYLHCYLRRFIYGINTYKILSFPFYLQMSNLTAYIHCED